MRSTMPRTRTVSCADADEAMQTKTRLRAARAREINPNMSNSRILSHSPSDTLSLRLFPPVSKRPRERGVT